MKKSVKILVRFSVVYSNIRLDRFWFGCIVTKVFVLKVCDTVDVINNKKCFRQTMSLIK